MNLSNLIVFYNSHKVTENNIKLLRIQGDFSSYIRDWSHWTDAGKSEY